MAIAISHKKIRTKLISSFHFLRGEHSQITNINIRYIFLSNHNINKSLSGHCFLASDPFIHRFYQNLLIKASEAQKQRPHKLLLMLWFDKKSISNIYKVFYTSIYFLWYISYISVRLLLKPIDSYTSLISKIEHATNFRRDVVG